MKALGAEIWDFWENAFPKDRFHDDNALEIEDDNGNCMLDPTEKYDLDDLGYLCPEYGTEGDPEPFSWFFLKWRKAKTTVTLVIEFDKNLCSVDAAKEQLKVLGFKVRA
jgi:hypothetical protein